MSDAPRTQTLDAVPTGRRVVVVRIEGDDGTSRRLDHLGFWTGTTVEVVRRAPFGDPVEYALQGYRLALRRGEARRVVVEAAPS